MIGKTISHYRILEKLGEGGMGVVYKAEDTKLKRTVALKFLIPQALGDEEEKTRFVQEAQAAAALEHPNICTVYEIDEVDGQTFIAMAFVEGQSLKEKIEANLPKVLNLREVLDISIQVAEGLQEAHEKGIVHRDIKPANIMVTSNGQLKIMDFGLAKLTGRTQLTKTGMTMGTAAYMSPEQAQGAVVDHRSDIFALAVVLYELLTGRQPFKGDYEQAIVYSILNEDPEPVTSIRTGVPMELEQIVNKCLEKNPANRYQHVDELIVDLLRLKKEQEKEQKPKKTQTRTDVRTKTQSKRKKLLVIPWIILGALILSVTGYYLFKSVKLEHISERKKLVVLPFENLGAAEDEYFADGMTEEITSRLASVSSLGIISRTSAVQYAKTEKSMKQMGEELGVEYALEGTIRWAQKTRDGSRVRITPQLIRVADDTHIWTDTYDRVIDDIFEIQSEIALKVVEQLGITLNEPDRRPFEVRPTNNLEAYQAYLRGLHYERQPHFTLENWRQVIQNYQMAVELDSGFSLAYAKLSKAHSRLHYLQHDLSVERLEMARIAAHRAIEQAPESPDVHLALSYYYLWAHRDVEQTLKELELAERGLSNNAEILEAKATIFQLKGRWEEALDHFERAFELNPRDAALAIERAGVLWTTRKYQQALGACNQAIALAPDAAWPYLYKAFTYWFWKGALGEARAALENVPENHGWAPWAWFWQEIYEGKYHEAVKQLSSTPGEWIRLKICARPKSLFSAYSYELMNKPQLAHTAYDSAMSLLEIEVQTHPDDPRYHSSLGIVYAVLGRKDEAIREGKRALELLPISKDAFYGIPYLQDLSHIYTLVGEHDAALDELERLLSIPSWFSVHWLQLDPRWNRLHDHPRFQKLLEKYSGDSS